VQCRRDFNKVNSTEESRVGKVNNCFWCVLPVGINEDTDASVEPRQGRSSSFLLAPLPGKRMSRKKQTDPKIQSNPNNDI